MNKFKWLQCIKVIGFLFGPNGQFRSIFMIDGAKLGQYEATAEFDSSDDIGIWNVYIIAQSVDPDVEYETPEEDAKTISGGSILNKIIWKIPSKHGCTIEIIKSYSFEIKLPLVK